MYHLDFLTFLLDFKFLFSFLISKDLFISFLISICM